MMLSPGRFVARAVTTVVTITAILIVGFLVVAPRVVGGATLTVLTGSMSPTIPAGAVVLIKPVEDVRSIAPGTIVTYQKSPTERVLVTHRVVRSQPDTTPPTYITKGDANRGEDIDPVPVGAIRGEVIAHVPYLGSIADQVAGPRGRYLIGLGIAILVIVTQSLRLVRALREPDDEQGSDANAEPGVPVTTTARA